MSAPSSPVRSPASDITAPVTPTVSSVSSIVTALGENVEDTGASIGDELRRQHLVAPGDQIVYVSVHAELSRRGANFLKLHRT